MFEVGDLVKFKTWDEMENEFGISEYDSINCNFHFTLAMEDMIDRSRTYTITEIDDDNMRVYFDVDPCDNNGFAFSTDMIKLASDESEDSFKNIIDTSKWKMNVSIPNFASEISARHDNETKYLVDIISTILLDQTSLFISVDSLIGTVDGVIKYYKRSYSDESTVVAFVEIGRENFNDYYGEDTSKSEIKIIKSENVTLLIVPRFINYCFNDENFIKEIVRLLSDAFPTDDENLVAIRECIFNNDESGIEIRDRYIKENVELKKKKALYERCDKLNEVLVEKKSKVLSDNVDRFSSQLREAERQYYRCMQSLEEAKKELSYFKFLDSSKPKDTLEEILRSDIESGELTDFKIRGDALCFRIVEPLLFFDDEEWLKVKDGVLHESEAQEYEPVLDAIFSRKCTLTIEQGALMYINGQVECLNNYSWDDSLSVGVPNAHIERYNCWNENRTKAYEHIKNGNYDLAYIQMKSAIAGINVWDSPVIIAFCEYMKIYSLVNCITDNETGQLFTIDEANKYYKELEKGEAA